MKMTVYHLGHRLAKAMQHKGVDKNAVAKEFGVKVPSVYDWLEHGRIAKTHIPRLLTYFGGTLEWWLESTKNDPFPTIHHVAEPLAAYHVNTEALHNVGKVPLIDWVAAGTWHDISDPYPAGMAEDWLYCPSRHGSKAYALRVRGESMHNPSSDQSFKDGDIIFVDPDKVAINKSLVICRLDDSKQTTFKRLLIDGDSKMLEALNPSWPERIIRVNGNATICGVIIGKYEVY